MPHTSTAAPSAAFEGRELAQSLATYRQPDHVRSALELVITGVPFVLLWVLAWVALDVGYWLTLLIAIPAAGFLVRLFLIQHDCGHGAFFRIRAANDWVGRVLGVITLTPYAIWRRAHAIHHASVGNLERRGIGDIKTLTVREYQALSWWGRLGYRLYRNPLVMFGIGPAYVFIVQQRWPSRVKSDFRQSFLSTMGTNVAIAVVVGALVWLVGLVPFLLVHLPMTVLAATAGVWLFYVQHQFEHTYWAHDQGWQLHEAALHGSSYYELPGILRWFTANIGVHHVHHLASSIPYYKLASVLRDHPELREVGRVTVADSLRCVRLTLWDEERRKLISFRDLKQAGVAAAA